MSSLLLFAVYEIALFVVAGRLVRLAWDDDKPVRLSTLALWIVAAKLYLGSTIAVAILLFMPDRLFAFRAAAALLAAAAVMAVLTRSKSRGPTTAPPWRPGEWMLAGAIAIGAGMSLAGAARPLNEFDSLHSFNWLIRWLVEGLSPYAFGFHYVSFWEAAFVPGVLLGQSRYLHVWLSAQSLLVYLLALYVLATRMALPRSVGLSIVAASAFLPWHWGWTSGVSTLKNDTLASAGFLMAAGLLVHRLRGERPDWRSGIALGLAITFITVKYGGPAFALLLLAFAAVLPTVRSRSNLRATIPMVLVALALALVGTGHFYFKNLVLHGNPLYPFALALGPLALQGTFDVAGTSIFSHLTDVRAWRLLFGLDGAGQPHMLLLRFAMVAPLIAIVVALARRSRDHSEAALVALLALAGWAAWVGSPWSAGIAPGSLVYLEELRSLRYATGIVGASLVVLAVLLLRTLSLPPALVCLPFIIDAALHFAMELKTFRPLAAWVSPRALVLAACATVAILAAAWFAAASRRNARRAAALTATLAGFATLIGVEVVARAQTDLYASSRAFTMSAQRGGLMLYRPQNTSEASFFSGLGYHLLYGDVLARLPAIGVHDERAPALPDGREGDLLVMHAIAPAEPRFIGYKARFDARIATTNWRPAYSDPVAAVYVWTQSAR